MVPTIVPEESNIKMNIKTRVIFEDETNQSKDIFSFIKDESNEQNLLLLVFLILSSKSDFDIYIKQIPFVGNWVIEGSFLITVIRCLILLILYLILRQYVLPKN